MILTDGVHLVSDTSVDELHDFAREAHLPRRWFNRGRSKRHPHYDLLTVGAYLYSLRLGAALVSSKELVKRMVGVDDQPAYRWLTREEARL